MKRTKRVCGTFKERFKHVLHDIFKKYFKHNYNIMVETVLTIKKTVNNLFGVNPFFGPNLTILLVRVRIGLFLTKLHTLEEFNKVKSGRIHLFYRLISAFLYALNMTNTISVCYS